MIDPADIVLAHASAGAFRSCAATHPGAVRSHNEDAFANRPDLGLWVVADGAGGHQSGEIASGRVAKALDALPASLSGPDLLAAVRECLRATHQDLRAQAARRGDGAVIATTVVVLLAREGHFACLWAGDSRAYMLRANELTQITRDHSLVQELLDTGSISAAEAETHPHANVITRAVGADTEALDLDKRTGTLLGGDRLLMCSDGLCKTLSAAALAALLGEADSAVAQRLVLAALDAQSRDNVTALTIEVLPTVAESVPAPSSPDASNEGEP